MFRRYGADHYRAALWGLATLLTIAVASTVSAGRSDIHEDRETCSRFGAHYGSPEFSRCMMVQQRRRDTHTIDALEQQRLSAEIAQRNLQTVRRMRCEREADKDRERGVRPRWCH